jgi:maltose O-acetyltransferase
LFELSWCVERQLNIRGLQERYLTARLRRLLGKSHTGLRIQHPVVIEHPEKVSIGQGGSIAAFLHIWGRGGVTIGDRVLIASHVSIVSETHDYTKHPMTETAILKPVVIEDDVWIGTHCSILPGVTIGRGAVVGAGAVVTRDIPPMSVNVGVPAKPVAYRPEPSRSTPL